MLSLHSTFEVQCKIFIQKKKKKKKKKSVRESISASIFGHQSDVKLHLEVGLSLKMYLDTLVFSETTVSIS